MGYYLNALLVALTALCWLLLATTAPEVGGVPVGAFGILASLTYFLTAMSAAGFVEALLMGLLQRNGKITETTDLLRGLTSMVLYGVALLLWLRYGLGFDVTNLLATSAVVTVILGLAMQNTLGNLFSGLSLELEHPLRVGDHVRIGATEGRVEALRWRSILVATADNTWIVVPNVALTSQIIEVIRRDVPSKMVAYFHVPADVPPAKVLSVARSVLKSDALMLLRDPAPSVVLVGTEADSESLRYALRFYSLAFLNKFTLSSQLLTRLWYALSREGIEMRADCAAVTIMNGAPSPRPAPKIALPPPGLPCGLDSVRALLSFGPREALAPDLFGFVVGGSAREEFRPDETEIAARVTQLLERQAPSEARYLIPEEETAVISARAARFIGPVASAIAERAARLTGDAYLVYHALARSIDSEADRKLFLADAPAYPTRMLLPGAPFGWARLLGFELGFPLRRWADDEADVFILRRADLIEFLRSSDAAELAKAISAEPGLAGCDHVKLVERLCAVTA